MENRALGTGFFEAETGRRKCQILSAETVTSELKVRNVRQMRTSCAGLRYLVNFRNAWWARQGSNL